MLHLYRSLIIMLFYNPCSTRSYIYRS